MSILNSILDAIFGKPKPQNSSEQPATKPPEPKPAPENFAPGELKPGRVVRGILDDTRLLLYKITSAFEGAELGHINYENITGNFDKQGLSIGFLQWCTGQGSDFPLFESMLKQYPKQMEEAFGPLFPEFKKTMSWGKKDRLNWAAGINTKKNQIKPDWLEAFKKLCRTKEFQWIQNVAAEEVFNKSVEYCDRYGVISVRALSLMFDIRTQNGSISEHTQADIMQARKAREAKLNRKLTEREFLEIIATLRAEASNPLWVADVKKRKLAIVHGKGLVHGTNYDFDKMGLSDVPFRVSA